MLYLNDPLFVSVHEPRPGDGRDHHPHLRCHKLGRSEKRVLLDISEFWLELLTQLQQEG